MKLAVQDKKILPLGHEKEQIYVQAVFPYFGRREPESIVKKGIRISFPVQMGNNIEIHQLKLGKKCL